MSDIIYEHHMEYGNHEQIVIVEDYSRHDCVATLMVSRNGYQFIGTPITPDIATAIIEGLTVYLEKVKENDNE